MSTESDNVNAGAIGTLVALLAITVAGTALALTALVRTDTNAEAEEGQPRPYATDIQAQDQELTAPAAWSDKEKGQVSMPIDQAMDLVVKKLKEDPQSATPAPPPAPDAGADAATEADGGTEAEGGATSADGSAAAAEAAAPAPEQAPPAPPAPEQDQPIAPKPKPKLQPAPPAPKPEAPGSPGGPAPEAPPAP